MARCEPRPGLFPRAGSAIRDRPSGVPGAVTGVTTGLFVAVPRVNNGNPWLRRLGRSRTTWATVATRRLVSPASGRSSTAFCWRRQGERPAALPFEGTPPSASKWFARVFAVDCFRFSRGRYQAIEQEARAAGRGAWADTFDTPAAFKGQNYYASR